MCEEKPANASCQAGENIPGTEPGSTQTCPEEQQLELVEIKEYVEHNGASELRAVAGRRQYINLDDQVDTTAAHPEYGRRIRLKAKVRWKSGDQSRSLDGQLVYWYDARDAGNRAGLTGNQQPGFNSEGSNSTRKTMRTNAEGWTRDPVDYYVSRYGGDKFDVWATIKSDYTGGLKAGTYEVWKKMWYEIAEMKRPAAVGGKFEMPAGTISKVVASYEKVFIEMVDAGGRDEGSPHTENFEDHNAAYTWADGYVNNVGVPWKVHYSIVDHVIPWANKAEKTVEWDAAAAVSTSPTTIDPFKFNGRTWLIEAKFQKPDASWVAFGAGKVTLVDPNVDTTNLKVDFAGSGITPTAAAKSKVKIKYYEAPGYNGWGGANLHLVICRRSMEQAYADLETAMAGTSIHEPGHALGLVYGSLAWKSTTNGDHCSHNACVMWWQGYTGRPLDFHDASVSDPGCHTHLRGMDMTRSVMNGKWKFPR